jgi:hypothetical protein
MNASVFAADEQVELNWLKYREVKDHWRKLEDGSPGEEVYDAAWDAVSTVECDLQSEMRTSVHALASVLMIQIEDDESSEDVPGVWRASLAAIRPQLVGTIAEAADRLLGGRGGCALMNNSAKRTASARPSLGRALRLSIARLLIWIAKTLRL